MVDLLAIGGAHIDRTAQTLQAHIAGASNPARISETVGGGAFNALRNAKMLCHGTHAIMSIRGGDSAGMQVEDTIDKAGLVDFSGTFMDRATPTYTAILDSSGDLITAIADMDLYETGFDRQVMRLEGRREIASAKFVLLDANLPGTAIKTVVSQAAGPIFAMCISPAKATRLLPVIDRLDIVFLNRRELISLTQDAELEVQLDELLRLGVRRAVITNGAQEVLVFEVGSIASLRVPETDILIDVTGAGDALTGATIASLMNKLDLPLPEAVTFGIAAAQMTLQINGPVCDAIATPAFETMHETVVAAQTS